MANVRTSRRAEEDLIGIWRYTCDQWGEEQADRYLDRIGEALTTLAANPMLGTPIDHIRPGYRRFPVAHHVLFYRPARNAVEIVRVLHESMDTERHL